MWLSSIFTAAATFAMWQTSLFADTGTEGPPVRDQGLWQTAIMIAIAVAFFYLILWRPEQKRRRAAEQLRTSLKKGDRVLAMGMIGTVVRIQDDTVIVKMYDGNQLEFVKGAISEVLSATEEDKNSRKDESK